MKAAQLDVNVVIALPDPGHEFYDSALHWFGRNRSRGWATCPLMENACLRIPGKAGYPQLGLTVTKVREILTEFRRSDDHLFWPDSISIPDAAHFEMAGPKNITYIYLPGRAKAHGGRLATFDRCIDWRSVAGGSPDDPKILQHFVRPM